VSKGGKSSSLSPKEEKALRVEIQYLQDPVKFADHVHYTLRCGKPEKALDLCRLASKEMDCIVAWNHTVDWHMQKGKVNDAFKIYNEMKKRAQFPDSYTYMMLLRGFPQHRTHHGPETKKGNVSKAVALFNSMSSPQSKVKPNIKHTNAALRVCSIAKDMDALWSIAGKLPTSGANSADHITYTILLGAIRCQDFGDEKTDTDTSPDGNVDVSTDIVKLKRDAVDEGRRIWQEIVVRWRQGEIILDHSLVCEMAHLLLLSGRMEDCDDILNLVQQTMNIPRLLPLLGSPSRKTDHVPKSADMKSPLAGADDSEGWTPASSANAFLQVLSLTPDSSSSRNSQQLAWVQPDNDILNCVLEACSRMRASKGVYAYWDAFVTERGLRPDLGNFHTLLAFMRVNRNSGKAAGLLQQMHNLGLEMRNKTFRAAMAVCSRDVKNVNVVQNATKIIEVMSAALRLPDVHTLDVYLSIAVSTRNGDQIIAALDAIQPFVGVYRSRAASGDMRTEGSDYDIDEEQALQLFRAMISAIDMVDDKGLLSGERLRELLGRRSELDGIVNRALNNYHLRRERRGRESSSKARFDTSERPVNTGAAFRRVRPPPMSMGKAAWDARTARYRTKRTGMRRADAF
jgi:pentatricopeptide repeat protein